MINSNKIISAIVIVLALLAGMTGVASAADLSWTNDTVITIGSANYTIKAGSTATSFVMTATDLQLVIPATETFSIISLDGYTMALSGADTASATSSCSGGTLVVITKAGGAATVTITPSTATAPCAVRRTTSAPTPTPTPTPTPASGTGTTPTPTPTPTVSPTPTPTVVPGPTTPNENSGVTLYRVEGDPRVYVVKDGKKNWIKTEADFIAGGYKWSDIIVTSESVVAAFPDTTGSSGVLVLYRADGDIKVYAVKDGVRQWIQTAEEFSSKGYKWADIVVTTPEIVASYPDGTVVAVVTVKVVNTNTLRVRKSNTTSSAILGYVKRNNVFTVLEEKPNWYKIQTSNGVIGWISGYYAAKQ